MIVVTGEGCEKQQEKLLQGRWQQKKTKENMSSLLNVCDLVAKDVESIFFCSQKEVNLCLELLSNLIIGCILMILVYFS